MDTTDEAKHEIITDGNKINTTDDRVPLDNCIQQKDEKDFPSMKNDNNPTSIELFIVSPLWPRCIVSSF